MIVQPFKGTQKGLLAFLGQYHYLGCSKFPYVRVYGAYKDTILVGVCVFSTPSSSYTIKKYFKVPCKMLELSRLALAFNDKNLASQFASECIRLEKKLGIEAILSYADASKHAGIVYQAMNFKYFGKTAVKRDMYLVVNGVCQKLGRKRVPSRGKVVALKRPQKHIYILPLARKIEYAQPILAYPKA